MASPTYTIQTMTRSELDIAIDWAAAEGWNPGLHDADCFYATDPNGFLMGYLDGEAIASLSAVKYDANFGFLGFYIVRPEYRGQGYGLQLWNAGLAYLAGCNIGLDGVVAQQENYIKSGFHLAYRNIRYEGVTGRTAELPTLELSCQIVPLADIPTAMLVACDRRFFPAPRPQFLQCWHAQPGTHGVGLLRNQALVGYGVIRPCQSGYKIGPLFADTPQTANAIFRTLTAKVELNRPVYLDVPEVNPDALALADRYQMSSMFETARMYTQQPPNLSFNQIFGVTTFELG